MGDELFHADTHTHTHTQKYALLVTLHCNNGFVNVPQCYVIRTLLSCLNLNPGGTLEGLTGFVIQFPVAVRSMCEPGLFCASQHQSPVITCCCTSCMEELSTAHRFMSLGHVGILRVLNFAQSPHLIVQLWDSKVCRWRKHRMTSRLPVNLSRYSARDSNREMWPTSVVSVPLHSWKNAEGRNVSCSVFNSLRHRSWHVFRHNIFLLPLHYRSIQKCRCVRCRRVMLPRNTVRHNSGAESFPQSRFFILILHSYSSLFRGWSSVFLNPAEYVCSAFQTKALPSSSEWLK